MIPPTPDVLFFRKDSDGYLCQLCATHVRDFLKTFKILAKMVSDVFSIQRAMPLEKTELQKSGNRLLQEFVPCML